MTGITLLHICYTTVESKMHQMNYNLVGEVNLRLKSVKFAKSENTGLSRSLQLHGGNNQYQDNRACSEVYWIVRDYSCVQWWCFQN